MRWFKPLGIVFLPVSATGWFLTILGFAFCVQVFVTTDTHSHSVSDTLYGVFPFWAPTLLGLAWIADRTGVDRRVRRRRHDLCATSRRRWTPSRFDALLTDSGS